MTEQIERKLQGWRKGLAGLLIGASLAFGGCGARPGDEINLKLTEDGAGGEKYYMCYGGMPNSDTFTFYDGHGNSYYPVEGKKIHFHNHDYEVLSVNPEEIKLKVIR